MGLVKILVVDISRGIMRLFNFIWLLKIFCLNCLKVREELFFSNLIDCWVCSKEGVKFRFGVVRLGG